MTKDANRPYLPALDIFRAFAIMAVIIIHTTSTVVANYDHHAALYPLYVFLNNFTKFAVPVFIFLSGFTLFYNYYDKPFSVKTIGQFYKKRMTKILIPFLFFSFLYFALTRYLQFGFTDLNTFIGYFTTGYFLKTIVIGKAHTHLYFVVIIIQFYVLAPLMLYAVQRFRFLSKHIAWLGLLAQWLFIYKLADVFHLINRGSYSFTYMLYFAAGAFIGIYYVKAAPWINLTRQNTTIKKLAAAVTVWALFLSSSMVMVYFYYENRLNKIFIINPDYLELVDEIRCVTAGLVLLQVSFWVYTSWSKITIRALLHIGACSFGIYLIHPLVLYVYRLIHATGNPLLYHTWAAGGFAVALLVSWAIVSLSAPFKWHFLLFGPLPSKKKPSSASTQPNIEA